MRYLLGTVMSQKRHSEALGTVLGGSGAATRWIRAVRSRMNPLSSPPWGLRSEGAGSLPSSPVPTAVAGGCSEVIARLGACLLHGFL